jgi:hypothetical protein
MSWNIFIFLNEVKPKLFSQLIYYNKLYPIEVRMPADTYKRIITKIGRESENSKITNN